MNESISRIDSVAANNKLRPVRGVTENPSDIWDLRCRTATLDARELESELGLLRRRFRLSEEERRGAFLL